MNALEPFASLAAALVAGLLIGIEREQSASAEAAARSEGDPSIDAPPAERGTFLGGIRTYPLFALVGAVAALFAERVGPFLLAVAFAGLVALVGLAYAGDVKRGVDRGITSEAALLLTFLLGALASTPVIVPLVLRLLVVLALAVVATFLLSAKLTLHRFADATSRDDVLATVKFLALAVIVLPLLPDTTFGPFDVLNPFQIGVFTLLIAGIGFAGYVAIRVLGSGRGMTVTGLVGGLVSSTAVTLSFAGRARREPLLRASSALAVVLASTVLFPRVLVMVAVVEPSLLPILAVPLGAMTVAGLVASARLYRESKRTVGEGAGGEVKFSNPFELRTALTFGLLYAGVLFVARAATEYAGARGTYFAGLLAGTTDVDAITLSMANLVKTELSVEVATTTILIGIGSNTLVKGGISVALGGWDYARRIVASFAAILVTGALGVGWIWLQR